MSDHAAQLDRLKTARADRYMIERELGAGGRATEVLPLSLVGGPPSAGQRSCS